MFIEIKAFHTNIELRYKHSDGFQSARWSWKKKP